jgi:aspartate aminotransferase
VFEEGIRLKKQYARQRSSTSDGESHVDPPEAFCTRLKELSCAASPGSTLLPNAGYSETRAAVARQVNEEQGLCLTADEVVRPAAPGGRST